jgi:hypothetical protein
MAVLTIRNLDDHLKKALRVFVGCLSGVCRVFAGCLLGVCRVFAGRSWPFDDDTARHHADVVTRRQRAGRPTSHEDAQIAAIARHHPAAVATRNIREFEGIERLRLINPWTEQPSS